MNILLIAPKHGFHPSTQYVPLGLLSIATYLKKRGYCVRLYDRNTEQIPLNQALKDFRPHVTGISAIATRQLPDATAIAGELKKQGFPVVWGGPMASIIPEMLLREDVADYIVIGEGEVTFLQLLQAIEQKRSAAQVKGIAFLGEQGEVCRTAEREFTDLAELPASDWAFVTPEKYFSPFVGCTKMTSVYVSKGCPGRCSFCINEFYHRCRYRARPIEHVIDELKQLVAHGMDGVFFADEWFGMDKRYLYQLCDQLRPLNIAWGSQTRLGHFTREDLQYMYDCGCRWLYFGVESGVPQVLERMNKHLDLTKIDGELENCKEIGIATISGFIIGLPDETEDELRESLRLMRRLDAMYDTQILIHTFSPIPGSELYRDLAGQGRLIPHQSLQQWGSYAKSIDLSVNYSNVPALELNVIQYYFRWRRAFRKETPNSTIGTPFSKTIAMAIIVLRNALQQGFLHIFRSLSFYAALFCKAAWYRFAYPGILKKYGLNGKYSP